MGRYVNENLDIPQTRSTKLLVLLRTTWNGDVLLGVRRNPNWTPRQLAVLPSLIISFSFVPSLASLKYLSYCHWTTTKFVEQLIFNSFNLFFIFVLLLYSDDEVRGSIWNQTHLVVLNLNLERLHYVTISHHKARSSRWYQWCELYRTFITVNFCNRDIGVRNLFVST